MHPGDRLLFESDSTGVRVRPVRAKNPFEKYRGIGNSGIPSGRKAVRDWVRQLRGAMTTFCDSNVVVALWDKDPCLSVAAQRALDSALEHGGLFVAAPVFAELLASGPEEAFLDAFFPRYGDYG